ncbi:2OG-Fe(II) oxygenase superfamily protein [Variovorax sp. SRS16]|uniref:isopenicillin N synthase family dioxygenase n=1 Tax=Variovorax sp. SRS16 TaxID=282217 RepID=UPI0013178F9E|nr:isopenicillin N synthase family oxygenase [Variovorax sp. SRS16]VTU14601.1 2OG-Fe(II) oxygenase superfamily protein [Variovorax sp. SRS16]
MTALQTVLDHVPVIDISPFASDSPSHRREVADQVCAACEQVGFLVITGHGVSDGVVDRLYRASQSFFALDEAEKLRVKKPAGTNPKGFTPQGAKTVGKDRDPQLKPSLLESFAIGPLDVTGDPCSNFGPNLWPERPAELKPAFSDYYREMERLSNDILDIFSLALDVPPAYFRERVNRHASILRANHYPALKTAPTDGEERAGAHTDITAITILKVDDAPGGLEVQLPNGNWVGVPRVPNAFIVNIGDILMRWTNDRFISTMHRVINPPPALASRAARISIPYFCIPNYDAMIECIPSCVGNGAKYPPMQSGQLLSQRYTVTFSLETGKVL